MIEAQNGVIARADEMRSSACVIDDASTRITARGRATLPSGAINGTDLRAVIDVALECVSRSLIDHAALVDAVAAAMVRSADSYDDGDRAFAASLTPRS